MDPAVHAPRSLRVTGRPLEGGNGSDGVKELYADDLSARLVANPDNANRVHSLGFRFEHVPVLSHRDGLLHDQTGSSTTLIERPTANLAGVIPQADLLGVSLSRTR